MDNDTITLSEAIYSLRGNPGLVYGPLATASPNSFSLIIETVVKRFEHLNDIDGNNLSIKLDELLIEKTDEGNALKREIYDELNRITDINNTPLIVKAGWSMCISLTRDLLFESALQNLSDSTPNSKSITIVDHFSVIPSSRTTPIYKLLGNMRNNDPDHTLVLAESELLKRKGIWRSMLGTCTDYLQGNPLLFFGIDESVQRLAEELLSTLSTLQPPAPNSLIFLKNDPLLKNPTIRALCSTFSVNIQLTHNHSS